VQQFEFRGVFTMTTALRGRPGRSIGPLKEKTVHAALTKQRIHAMVSQVIDELELPVIDVTAEPVTTGASEEEVDW
jgi:hypothetical protein